MFKKITTLVVIGFVAVTKATETNLFSLFKAPAGATEPVPIIKNAESHDAIYYSEDGTKIMKICDSSKDGLIT